ncbi:MAG: ribokinase, partial [Pseudomonadota bacterium]
MADIVVLGIFVADAAFRADRMPNMGETVLGQSFALGPGGKGSNQAVAASRAGGDVAFLGKVGQDPFGDMALRLWQDAGVTPAVSRPEGAATGAAFIYLDAATGDNAIIVAPGVASTLSAADMDAQAKLIGGAKIFLTQLEQPMDAAHRALQIASDRGALTLLNPAPAADLPDGMLSLCDYVTPNENEAEALTGIPVTDEDSARAAAAHLLAQGVRRATIITMGAQGALYHDADLSVRVPAVIAGDVVETTGAGDAFNGAFAAALTQGQAPL